MDIFENRYYRINKYLLTCLGQWPFQKPLHKRLIRTILNCLTVSIVLPEILRMIEVWGQLDYVVESGSVLGVQFANNVKLSNYIFNEDKLKGLMTRIRDDWKANRIGPQLKILEDYANEGRKLTLAYTGYMYSTLALYLIMPTTPKVLDIVMPLNESRPSVYPIPTKYGNVDAEKYYFPIMIHADIAAILVITTIVAMDTTYAVYVQHACGIFAALGHRLENLMESKDYEELDQLTAKQQEEATYRAVVSCVKMHKDAIESAKAVLGGFWQLCDDFSSRFANAIESSHVIVLFFVFGMSVFCMTVAGYQMVMNLEKPNEAIRFATFTVAQVAHIFFISWPGQKLIDHSERIYEWVYEARWYLADNRSKKLLMLMMLRSIEPCRLTAGKFYVMSLVNFSLVVRTSMSYFTMLTSFR